MNRVIQGLWIGSKLSIMERLSISSFLSNGHQYHLYVYDQVERVPVGTVLKDGDEILPSSMIFQYRDHKSYSAFSNFFRYKLLAERGGWWVDTDIICLKRFDFKQEYVFSSELAHGNEIATSAVIKAPAASAVMSYAWQVCQGKRPEELAWGEVGPKLVAEAVKKMSLEEFVLGHRVFCPISYGEWESALDPDLAWEFDSTTYAIHLWNEMWRRAGRDKNQSYDPHCLYEQLKKRYLPQ